MILGSNSQREREASWVRLQLSAVQGLVNVAMLDLFDRILRGGIDLHLGVLRILTHIDLLHQASRFKHTVMAFFSGRVSESADALRFPGFAVSRTGRSEEGIVKT